MQTCYYRNALSIVYNFRYAYMSPIPPQIESVIGMPQDIVGLVVILVSMGVAWGTLKKSVSNLEGIIKEMRSDLKDIRERFGGVEEKVDVLWKDKYAPAHSPRQLNERGAKVLEASGIKEIVDEKKSHLLGIIKKEGATNAYDAELVTVKVMMELPRHCPDAIDKLKEGAFRVGASIEDVLFVGSVYLRDLVFKDLGFSLDDLDKQKS